MSRIRKVFCFAALFSFLAVLPSFALIGIGAHYGMDFTLGMKNTTGLGDQLTFDSLKLDLNQGANSVLSGSEIPAFVTRRDFKSDFAFGGKIYIDVIPFIDAVEVSGDFGLWDYVGQVKYPTGIINPAGNLRDPQNFTYDSTKLTLDQMGLGYMGLKTTPYAKLQLDLTVRKYIVRFPKRLKVLNLYGGAGLSVNFATPMLSSHLVEDVINESAQGTKTLSSIADSLLDNTDVMKGVVKKIIGGLTQPSYGAHIDLGLMVKIPIIPIGVYVDGKFMIPFGKLDKYVDIGGMGMLVNAGIALAF
jgi:hypothetical protein